MGRKKNGTGTRADMALFKDGKGQLLAAAAILSSFLASVHLPGSILTCTSKKDRQIRALAAYPRVHSETTNLQDAVHTSVVQLHWQGGL